MLQMNEDHPVKETKPLPISYASAGIGKPSASLFLRQPIGGGTVFVAAMLTLLSLHAASAPGVSLGPTLICLLGWTGLIAW
jgi:hypothetical protein